MRQGGFGVIEQRLSFLEIITSLNMRIQFSGREVFSEYSCGDEIRCSVKICLDINMNENEYLDQGINMHIKCLH